MTTPFVPISGKKGKDTKRFAQQASQDLARRQGQTEDVQRMLMQALQNPTGQAQQFLPFFQQAAQGAAAPALRDFEKLLAGSQANIASRFGGNVSSEELRVVRNTSDDFTRNLTEALARVGPAAVGAGFQQTEALGAARRMMGSEELDIARLLLEAIQSQKSGGFPLGKLLGTIGGGVAGTLIPGVGTAAGAGIGGSIF
ncbi:MAG: hypothetical protein OER21_10765 [Gemmatimonadota bacterium]|nr:hypothetical protein [Gemmatimonadota bacterium]